MAVEVLEKHNSLTKLTPHHKDRHDKMPIEKNHDVESGSAGEEVKETKAQDGNKGLYAALFYAFMSISITFFNKAVFAVYKFPYPNVLVLGQMIFSMFFLISMRRFKYIDFPPFDRKTAMEMAIVGLCFFLMASSGLQALSLLTVPIFSALRRFTTFVVIVLDFALTGRRVSSPVFFAVLTMVFGGIIAGVFDEEFSLGGYIWVGINCLVTAGYLVLINRQGKSTGLNTFGLMFYTNLFAIPSVILLCFVNEEFPKVFEFGFWGDFGFLTCFMVSAVQAFLLNYSIFLCTSLNSPLATSITGNMKNIFQTSVGLFLFGDVTITFWGTVGLVLGVVGSFHYSFAKLKEERGISVTSLLQKFFVANPAELNDATKHKGAYEMVNQKDDALNKA
eukprot:GFYU01017382.1.p1 GENE.GFYU01017382.1~~GFYU01017382.1.p1  ORF type:complete len:391 (+),score=136.78 GFYU01017382.1:170-1342(+)